MYRVSHFQGQGPAKPLTNCGCLILDRSSRVADSDVREVRAHEHECTHVTPVAYSIADAVRVCGIGRTMLFAEIRAGRIKARKFGSRTLILADDLKRYLEALPQSPGTLSSADAGSDRIPERIVNARGGRNTASRKRDVAR